MSMTCVQMRHQLRRSPRLLSTMIGRVPTNHCLCQASRDHATPTLVLPVPVTTASIYVKDRLVGEEDVRSVCLQCKISVV